MDIFNDFVSLFTDKKFENVIRIRNNFFQITEEQNKILATLKAKRIKNPEFIGEFLGTVIVYKKRFEPSITLIKKLSKMTDRKVTVNEKGEFLFLCGRNLLRQSVIGYTDTVKKNGMVIVCDHEGLCLGYGRLLVYFDNRLSAEDVVVKNLLDLGDFLRREQSK
ncbi:MAG: hypothetical protein WC755_00450 [Candidatus Woesearchaeota archaeon]